MDTNFDFENIRSYRDEEVQPVLQRLLKEPAFIQAVNQIHPQWDRSMMNQVFSEIKTIRQFQGEIIYATLQKIIKSSTKGLTASNYDLLEKKKGYLFISNHRDIVLDSAFLNFILYDKGFETTQIAIGSNLMIYPWIEDLVKLNRSFIVERNVPKHDMYQASLKLSTYIRQSLEDAQVSVWIAQREGRAKNGDDRTQPGLLKMLGMSGSGSFTEDFSNLNILPLSISYEYDPCDGFKVLELLGKADNTYQKTIQDDLKSMYLGITGPKGRTHFTFGRTMQKEIKDIAGITNKNDQLQELSRQIDRQIHQNYQLWPSNYVAFDILQKTTQYQSFYSQEDKAYFKSYMEKKLNAVGQNNDQGQKLFLEMYANPVINKQEAGE